VIFPHRRADLNRDLFGELGRNGRARLEHLGLYDGGCGSPAHIRLSEEPGGEQPKNSEPVGPVPNP